MHDQRIHGLEERRPEQGPLALLCCPNCRSTLRNASRTLDDVDQLECSSCGSDWPVRFGIPDLRPPGTEDPYLSRDDDVRAAERLANHAASHDFTSVLASYYETNARVSAAQARQFIAGTLAAADRARTALRTWQSWSGEPPGDGARPLLDLGCGTGPLAVAAAALGHTAVAVDVGMRWLVLAAVRAREAGVPVTFACAGAEALPLATGTIGVVAGESVLENLPAPDRALQEAARVLEPGGWIWIAAANRWSIGPDPHLGLPMGGWLPERAVAAYARRRGMVPPRRRLVGARGLRRMLEANGFSVSRIEPPAIADAQRQAIPTAMRLAVNAYDMLRRLPAGGALLRTIGPSLIAAARRGPVAAEPRVGSGHS